VTEFGLIDRMIRRFEVELSATLIILLSIFVLRGSQDAIVSLTTIYLVGLSIIYVFRNGT